MKKSIRITTLVLVLVLLLPPFANAQDNAAVGTNNENVRFMYEGNEVSFKHGVYPVNGVATAALCDIVKIIGAQCSYDPTCKGIVLRYGKHNLRFTVGASTAVADGEPISLQTPVFYMDGLLYISIEDVMGALRLGYYADTGMLSVYITKGVWEDQIPDGVKVPILMYHAVSDEIWGIADLFVKPVEMEKQLEYLTANGYTPITFEDLPRVHEIEKPIMLTFDDGYRDNYTELFPLLKEYNVKATVFVITNAVGNDLYLTPEMIAEMSASGLVSIQSHTDTHPDLGSLNEEDTRREFEDSRLKLMRITGKQPFVLCYPMGKYSNTTLGVIGEYYSYGLKMNGGVHTFGSDNFLLNRIYIARSTNLDAFISKIKV